jgi:Ca-activated chloride channel family protein
LKYLWARTRIGRLSDFNYEKGNSENQAEITSMGLTYNLLTAYTSFVAVDETVRNPEADSKEVHQPLPLPKNVSNLAVGCSVSKVPEPEMVVLLAALAVMFAVTVSYRGYRRYFRYDT